MDQAVDSQATTSVGGRGRPSRWRWWAAVAVAAVVVWSVTAWIHHYTGADPLVAGRSAVWNAPDAGVVQVSSAGGRQQAIVPARADGRQGFHLRITNPSSVSQTILGLKVADSTRHERAQVALGSDHPGSQWHSPPVVVPPHGHVTLRVTFAAGCIDRGDTAGWSGLPLRVRVGHFNRTEIVRLAPAMALRGTAASEAECP